MFVSGPVSKCETSKIGRLLQRTGEEKRVNFFASLQPRDRYVTHYSQKREDNKQERISSLMDILTECGL